MNRDQQTLDWIDGPAPGEILNAKGARKARDDGMERVARHADDVSNQWSQRAYEFLVRFRHTRPTFLTEDVRIAAAGVLPKPPDARAWGPVVMRARRAGLLLLVGYESQRSVSCHGSPKPRWRANSG